VTTRDHFPAPPRRVDDDWRVLTPPPEDAPSLAAFVGRMCSGDPDVDAAQARLIAMSDDEFEAHVNGQGPA
jgi:hypothetical protein